MLVCGGTVTEPEYFAGLKKFFRNPAVQVRVKKKAVDPRALVEYAITLRSLSPDEFDEVWCVTDVDQFDVTSAIDLALTNEIRLAISNPCFEVWLLLHFVARMGAIGNPAEAVRLLKRHVPGYSKSELRFDQFSTGVQDAIARARGLSPSGEEQDRNPSSGVWTVTEIVAGT